MRTHPTPIELFYAYSHRDEGMRDELEKQLSILRRQGAITNWHDRRIGAGTEWNGQIDGHLNSARVILLLVSSDFLASDYCYDVEMTRALARHEAGEARVIPVILRPCLWKHPPMDRLQALPRDGKAVTTWPNIDEAFLNVAEGIRREVEELAATLPTAQPRPPVVRRTGTLPPPKVTPEVRNTRRSGTPPPHIFTGTATLEGQPAPDGTLVIAWIDNVQLHGASAAVQGPPAGKYTIQVLQPLGASYGAKTIMFTLVEPSGQVTHLAKENATWRQGDATVLNLTV